MKAEIEQLAREAGAYVEIHEVPGASRDDWKFPSGCLEVFVEAVAKRCAGLCLQEAADRRNASITFPGEPRNPAYLRGGITGATQSAQRILKEFGLGVDEGPAG